MTFCSFTGACVQTISLIWLPGNQLGLQEITRQPFVKLQREADHLLAIALYSINKCDLSDYLISIIIQISIFRTCIELIL